MPKLDPPSRGSAPTRRRHHVLHALLSAFRRARAGNVAIMFAIIFPVLVVAAGGVMDLASIVDTKTHLQDATDAATLVASAETAQNPNTLEPKLKTDAGAMLTSDDTGGSITDFHVCAPPTQNDCVDQYGTMTVDTVSMTTTALAPCYLGHFLPGVCTGVNTSKSLYVHSVTTIGFSKTLEINMLLDTSGSMIVGASAADNNKIIAWNSVDSNWAQVHYGGEPAQNRPCAFACHDEGNGKGQTSVADMATGLTNAHVAGATTRFDLMQTSAQALITHVQTEVAASQQLSKNTYYWNVYQFNDLPVTLLNPNDPVTNKPKPDTTFTGAQTALTSLSVGIDTNLIGSLSSLASTLGANGNGSTTPLKFLVLVTDGLNSDFTYDFNNCTGAAYNPAWGAGSVTYTGCYDTPISQTACNTIKNNGIVLAVLETPYVQLPGQDPGEGYGSEGLYDVFVRNVIYPSGPPPAASAVSTALQSCASVGYYFYASSDTQIASGFTQLTDNFIASVARLQQ